MPDGMKGTDRLARTMRKSAKDVADTADADYEVAKMVRDEARRRAPFLTGRLRYSIEATRDGRIITDLIYSARQHFKQQRGTAHHLFLNKATEHYNRRGSEAEDEYRKHVQKQINKIEGV